MGATGARDFDSETASSHTVERTGELIRPLMAHHPR